MVVTRSIVIGAGIAGLLAARNLAGAGRDVIVLDKGRSVGGRLATRRIGEATLDHGAQFFTVRTDTFAAVVQPLLDDGLVYRWCGGFGGAPDGHPRYAVRGGMTQLAKHVASGLDVRCDTLAFAVRRGAQGSGAAWSVGLDDGSSLDADEVVITCPLAQSFSLLVTADVDVPEQLWRTEYDRTLALLAVLDGPSAVADPGGLQGVDGFTFVADNQRKGISALPALTMHADPAWSEAHWDLPADDARALLLAAARPFMRGTTVLHAQLKRWRFATPRAIWPQPCWLPGDGSALALAGDAFDGPRVEGAALSGLAAATALLSR